MSMNTGVANPAGLSSIRINFKPWSAIERLPIVMQTEASECGLACLAMISGYHGHRFDIATIRDRIGSPAGGVNIRQLSEHAHNLGLSSRVVRSQLGSLRHLQTPCILHWGMDHFVVLKKAGKKNIVIHDPMIGVVQMEYARASEMFTGYAVELTPNETFEKKNEQRIPTLKSIMGKTSGLVSALAQIFALALLLEIVAIVSPAAMQWMIDQGLGSTEKTLIYTVVAGLALLMITNIVIGLLRGWMVMYLSTNVGFQWASRILNHLFRLPVDFFEKRHLGDVMSRFGSVGSIQQTVTTGVIEAILDGLLSVGTFIMLWLYSPLLATSALIAVLLLCILQFSTFSLFRRLGNESLLADARVSTNLIESLRGMRSIKLANIVTHRHRIWQALTVDAINLKVRTQWMQMMVGAVSSVISGSQRIIAIFIAATLITKGEFTIGMLFAYLSYQDQFISRASGLVGIFFQFRMLNLHFERLGDIVLTDQEEVGRGALPHGSDVDSTDIVPTSSSYDPTSVASVQFKDVCFRYSNASPLVLDNISFNTIGKKCTVITGRSGVGKTTIAKVMMGIYKPSSGSILISGRDIETVSLQALRDEIACVLQGDMLYGGSIAENIAFFDSPMNRERVVECATIACIHTDILKMPLGYETPVGDMGSMLSGGQKQRLLLARALYRQPRILLLDEATSDLDVATEKAVNENLSKLDVHRIYIAHRPQTIAYGDNVIRIE